MTLLGLHCIEGYGINKQAKTSETEEKMNLKRTLVYIWISNQLKCIYALFTVLCVTMTQSDHLSTIQK